MLILFGDKIRSQTKPFLYLFQLVAAKDPVHEARLAKRNRTFASSANTRLRVKPAMILSCEDNGGASKRPPAKEEAGWGMSILR